MKFTIKTTVPFISALTVVSMLTACGSSENTANDTTNTTAAETTTTTTTVTTTAEPETTTETTTTTEATTTTAEPETDTDTEATTTEAPADETTVVTMADNADGMYTIEECFRRKAEEATGKKVVKFDYYKDEIPLVVVFEDESMALLTLPTNEEAYDSTSLYSVDSFAVGEASGFECSVDFMP